MAVLVGLLLFIKRVYSWRSHLYKGHRVGMQAATTPNKTSHVRQYQFGMLSPFQMLANMASSPSAFRSPTSRVTGYVLIVENCPD